MMIGIGLGTGRFGNYITPQKVKAPANTTFAETLTADKVNTIVAKLALTNEQRLAEAVSRADSGVFLATHPEFVNSQKNRAVINKLLKSWDLYDNSTYPDFQRAYDFAKEADLLDLDKAEIARQQDHPLTTFVGPLTKRTYDNFDALLLNERDYALHNMPAPSEDEEAFVNDLSQEQQLAALKEAERIEQHKAEVSNTGINSNAWMTLHPEYIDSPRNGRIMAQQLKCDGVLEGEATIEHNERAFRKVRSLLTLNNQLLEEQHKEELKQRAADAVAEPGSIFDKTSIEEMEKLSLDELRRRADVALSR